ncbi:MAG: PilZ domain-containing protein [Bdellovibrionales bacterium]|nr:PilZ domain-containing protein [Bdellovibrionales bacterium]
MERTVEQQRLVPRYPLPREKVKLFFEDGERVFGVRDISTKGLGITLLEHGEALLFPVGFEYNLEMKLGGEPFRARAKVVRASAWAAGFVFESLGEGARARIERCTEPIRVGKSLKPVPPALLSSQTRAQGVSAWYHGDGASDLYLWFDRRGGLEKALLAVGERVWEWQNGQGVATGSLEPVEEQALKVVYDAKRNPEMLRLAAGVLEHAEVLDFRLLKFLKEQLRSV